MPCTKYGSAILCWSPVFRLRLLDGRYVFMTWHNYLGPEFCRDRAGRRPVGDWWNDELVCRAIDWFVSRGLRG